MMISKSRIARLRLGLRQLDLGDRVGVSPSLICLYESGDRTPSLELAAKINKILGAKIYREADDGDK